MYKYNYHPAIVSYLKGVGPSQGRGEFRIDALQGTSTVSVGRRVVRGWVGW